MRVMPDDLVSLHELVQDLYMRAHENCQLPILNVLDEVSKSLVRAVGDASLAEHYRNKRAAQVG